MGMWLNLLGTVETSLSIGKAKATITTTALTAARSYALPDTAGTVALTSDTPIDKLCAVPQFGGL